MPLAGQLDPFTGEDFLRYDGLRILVCEIDMRMFIGHVIPDS
jgi:hypothetical protein